MSVPSTDPRVSYTGNNSSVTAYAYAVEFMSVNDLTVYVLLTSTGVLTATLIHNSGMVVTQNPDRTGSFVTTAAWSNLYTLVAYRTTPLDQTATFDENARFPAESVETAFDRTEMQLQEIASNQLRQLGFPPYANPTTVITPVVDSVFTFDAFGAALLRTRTAFIAWLNLVPGSFTGLGQKVFANNADRTSATPDYVGQLGTQVDTGAVYRGTALTAGSWTLYTTVPGAGTVTATMLAAALDLSLKTLTLPTSVIGPTNISPTAISGQTQKVTLVNADRFLLWDSATSTLKYVLRSDITASASFLPFAYAEYATSAVLSANIPLDDTAPDIGEGTQVLSVTVTPTLTTDVVRLTFNSIFGAGGSTTGIAAVFRGSTCVGVTTQNTSGTNIQALNLNITDAPVSTSPQTYTIRVGAASSNIYLNGNNSRKFGGAAKATLTAQVAKP